MLKGSWNEDSTLVSGNLASRVSADRAWGTVNIQLHYGFAAHHYWVRGPRLRNSYTGDGSNVEAAVQTAPGPLHRIGFADRIPDYSRIRYFSN